MFDFGVSALLKSRCSAAALTLGIALIATGCAKKSDGFQAALCTSTPGEAQAKTCESPRVPVSLTLPRSELLRKVPVDADEVTGSSGSREGRQNDVAQRSPESESPPAAPATPAASPAPAPEPAPVAAPVEAAPARAPAPTAPLTIVPAAVVAPPTPVPAPDSSSRSNNKDEKPKDPKAKDADRDARIDAASKPEKSDPEQSKAEVKPPKDVPRQDESILSNAPSQRSKMERDGERGPAGPPMTLSEAVRRALGDNPLIGVAGARVTEAAATIGVSQSQLYPQVEGRVGVGHGVTGSYLNSANLGYFSNDNASGAIRGEASLAGRQLLFDFGATQADINRTSALHRSEQLKLREQTEDIVSKVTDVYLKLLEQRELLSAATENVAALEKIVKLVEDNEKNGNGTVADMKRVRSRLVDGQTALADAKSELQTGGDRFKRLVHVPPGTLRHAPVLTAMIPKSPDAVISQMPKTNPRLQALNATLVAARHEAEAQKLTALPKVAFESDVGLKEYRTRADKTELDAKGMITFKYKFFDGGLQARQMDQVNSRVLQTELRLQNEVDDLEAEVRKNYRILNSARGKSASLTENVETAMKARQLYDEQFRGGKRTLLELLDIQTTYYSARRTLINNRFEEQRSVNAVLLASGKLTEAMLGGRVK